MRDLRHTTDGSVPTADSGQVLEGGSLVNGEDDGVARSRFQAGLKPKVVTRTYLFPKDIVRQSPDGLPPTGFPYDWGFNFVDYGMDQRVVKRQAVQGSDF